MSSVSREGLHYYSRPRSQESMGSAHWDGGAAVGSVGATVEGWVGSAVLVVSGLVVGRREAMPSLQHPSLLADRREDLAWMSGSWGRVVDECRRSLAVCVVRRHCQRRRSSLAWSGYRRDSRLPCVPSCPALPAPQQRRVSQRPRRCWLVRTALRFMGGGHRRSRPVAWSPVTAATALSQLSSSPLPPLPTVGSGRPGAKHALGSIAHARGARRPALRQTRPPRRRPLGGTHSAC